MINFNKYWLIPQLNNQLLQVLDCGYNSFKQANDYPQKTHPQEYFFSWEKGRRLQEYQLVFIARGGGVFETETTKLTTINAGTLFLLFPNKWHRFKPNRESGWDEYWIGIQGDYAKSVLEKIESFGHEFYCFDSSADLHDLFIKLTTLAFNDWQNSTPLLEGIVANILGLIQYKLACEHQKETESSNAVSKTILYMQDHLNESLDMQQVAREMNIGYSLFRKRFKEITGFSPAQYLIELRFSKARKLLKETNLSAKEIAFMTGFESEQYFNRLFKAKNSNTPNRFRKDIHIHNIEC